MIPTAHSHLALYHTLQSLPLPGTKRSTNKNSKHDSIKKQYFAQIQKKINKTRKNIASSKKRTLRTTHGPKITKNIFQTIHHVVVHTNNGNNIQTSPYQSDSTHIDDPT